MGFARRLLTKEDYFYEATRRTNDELINLFVDFDAYFITTGEWSDPFDIFSKIILNTITWETNFREWKKIISSELDKLYDNYLNNDNNDDFALTQNQKEIDTNNLLEYGNYYIDLPANEHFIEFIRIGQLLDAWPAFLD